MDTEAFLRRILPGTGNYIVAEPKQFIDKATGKTRTGWKYHKLEHVAAAAAAIGQIDDAERTAYFAVNSYGDWYEEADKKTGNMRKRIRTQKNVVACRSLYDDIDIGKDGCYETRKEAGEAIKAFAQATGLPPLIVNSGGGYHLYWPLTEDVTPEEWLRLANLKRAVTSHFGLKVDHAVDLDSARVLRPVGSHNRKQDTPREVKVMLNAGPYQPAQFERAMLDYATKHSLTVLPPTPKSGMGMPNVGGFDDLGGGIEYPPSSAHEIIKHCPTLAQVAMHRGNVTEPLWRGMLGVVKHTTEGEELAHEWSSGHPDYDPGETQEKLDNWATGPTLCSTFAKDSAQCADCPHNGKAKSPITLGYTDRTTAPEIVAEATDDDAPVQSVTPQHWPQGFHWDGQKLSKAIRNEDGGVDFVPFANALFFPVTRVREEDGTWGIQIRANPLSRNDRTFIIPTKTCADQQALGNALASYEVFTVGKMGRQHAMDYLQNFIHTYQINGIETITYPHFGWYKGHEAFVLGSTKIDKNGESEALPSKNIGGDLAHLHECSGDINDWIELIDQVYNRKGAEAYQFVICAAFASPLVEFSKNNVWHGIPIALTGASGVGKTSAMSVACSLYGPPDKFLINGGTSGSTVNAALAQFAAMRNLPIILDEITGRSKEDIRDLLYALSNGRSKIRLTSSGEPHTLNKGRWNMLSFISGNEEFSEMLNGLSNNVAEATELRVFDIKMPEGYSDNVWGGTNVKEVVEQQLSQQYGHAGRKWIKFLIRNQEKVNDILNREMAKHIPSGQSETQERFYYNALIHVVTAGRLAKKLGLIRFDMDALWLWGIEQIKALRTGRTAVAKTPEDYLAQFLASIHGKIIVTKKFRAGRTNTPEVPVQEPRVAPVARQALEDRKLFVAVSEFNDWCRHVGVSPGWLRDELVRLGCIVKREGEEVSRRESLGKGTNMPMYQTKIYELNYARALSAEADPDASGKIIHLPGKSAVDDVNLDMPDENAK